MKIVLATSGSLGDLHPFIAVALALRARGHDTVIATHGVHRETVEAAGLAFHRLRPDDDDIAARTGMDMAAIFARMARDRNFLLEDLTLPFLPQAYDDALAACEGAHVVVAHNLAFAAILAAERLGLPLARVVLAPVMLQSASDPSVTPPAPYWPGPRTGLALAYNRRVRGVVRRVIRGLLAPLRAFRIQIGLPPTRQDYFFDFGQPHAAAAVLGLYSPAFAPAQSDQPARLTLTGFTAYDGAQALDPALAAFLSAGPPPIVFSLGSFAVFAPGDFYRDSLAAARTLGRRAVLLTGEAEATRLGPADGPDVFISAYAPHAGVFPHAAAIIHHGGIGTTAQALRAGRPQLVTPFLGDQPDNAARLVRLGVARQLAPRRYDARRAVVELGRLLDDARHAQAAQAIAPTFRAETGAQVAADAIEALAPGVHTA